MKKLMLAILACFTFGSLAIIPSCKSGNDSKDAIDLKLNFKTGDKYLYTTEINQNIGLMQGLTMNQAITMEMLYHCKADSAGVKALEITYDHIAMSMTSPMGEMKYDSRSSAQSSLGTNLMDSLIGRTFTLNVAPDGQIVSVTGLDALIASFNTGDNPLEQQNIENQLNDTAIRMMMQNSFDMYPGHKVKVGDTWNKKQRMTVSGIDINMDNTYTLKAVENGKAILSVASDLNLPNTELGDDSVKTQMQLSGKQNGTVELDIATGQVLNSKIVSDITGKMVMDNTPQNISIKSTTSVSSKKQ